MASSESPATAAGALGEGGVVGEHGVDELGRDPDRERDAGAFGELGDVRQLLAGVVELDSVGKVLISSTPATTASENGPRLMPSVRTRSTNVVALGDERNRRAGSAR